MELTPKYLQALAQVRAKGIRPDLTGTLPDGTVRPRHTRFFPGGLWQMIIENATSRIFLGVHWMFDAFDFTEDNDGNLQPDLTTENIGGVGLGLRIARDIFMAGGGLDPKMTLAGAANPPITMPPANSPMPQVPNNHHQSAAGQERQPKAARAAEKLIRKMRSQFRKPSRPELLRKASRLREIRMLIRQGFLRNNAK